MGGKWVSSVHVCSENLTRERERDLEKRAFNLGVRDTTQ